MKFVLMGLEGMAGNMARRWRQQDVEVVVCDDDTSAGKQLAEECGVVATTSVVAALRKLPSNGPKVVWLMLSDNTAVDKAIKNLASRLSLGDIVVDGTHSNYHDSQRRGALLSQSGAWLVDAGIIDGGNGLAQGYCLTVGGERVHVKTVEPLLQALAADNGTGWAHVGLLGAGHFARMVHSGIESGVRQALGEGFALLQGKTSFSFDLSTVANTWIQGSALGGGVLGDVLAKAEANATSSTEAQLPNYDELRWSAIEAVEQNVAVPVISAALQHRTGQRDI